MSRPFPYKWKLAGGYPAKGVKESPFTAFGTFVCAGGSTMGYKLAGFKHLGGVEIDERPAKVYKANHKPKFFYTEDIRDFNQRESLPDELYNLDLLDGSPPCSTFSEAGQREQSWGVERKFKEGQKVQRLDDLVFEYVKTIEKLQPKVALLENVKGLIRGQAQGYTREINRQFSKAGYRVQIFLLNAASMGVPQMRERVFFIGLREEFDLPKLKLKFNQRPPVFGEFDEGNVREYKKMQRVHYKYWRMARPGQKLTDVHPKRHYFNAFKVSPQRPVHTITSGSFPYHWQQPRYLTGQEIVFASSFPSDFDFCGMDVQYLCGMSVPPVMTANIASQIRRQWLEKISV